VILFSTGEFFKNAYMKYKDHRAFGMYTLFKPNLIVADPDLIRTVLTKEFGSFHDRGMYFNEKVDPLSAHLFLMPGKKWRNLRVKLTPTFTSGKMKQMFPIMKEYSEKLAKCLNEKAQMRDSIEMKDMLARYSTDVIMSTAFGIESNCIEDPNNKYRGYQKKILEIHPIWIALSMFAPKVMDFFCIPFTDQSVTSFYTNMFRETVEYRQSHNIVRYDFVNLLLQLMKRDYVDPDDDKKITNVSSTVNKLTLTEATAQSYVFFVAGFETSSTTATYALYELAQHQDIQDKVRKEIDEVLQKHGELTYDAVCDMTYLHKVVNETLRKYPPLPVLNRVCTKEITLPTTNIRVPEGTLITIPIFGLHRDPSIYPNPDKFDPERFNADEIEARHSYAYLPFGEGPRNCIGSRFGYAQTKVGLVSLLSRYIIKLHPRTPVPLIFSESIAFRIPLKFMLLLIRFTMVLAELIGVSIFALSILYIYYKFVIFNFWHKRGVFYVKPVVPTGNLTDLVTGKMSAGQLFQNAYIKYKDHRAFGMYTLFKPNLVIADPDLIRTVLTKEFGSFHDRGLYFNEKVDPLSGNLVLLPGKKWRNLRVKLTSTFSSGKIKQMFPIMKVYSEKLAMYLKEKAQMRDSIEMKDMLQRYSTDVIMSTALGVESDCIEDPNNIYQIYQKKIVEVNPIWVALSMFAPGIMDFFSIPATDRYVTNFYLNIFRETVEYRQSHNIVKHDFVNLLIQLMKRNYVDPDDKKTTNVSSTVNKLTMTEAAATSYGLFLGGFETSATTATFALYELAQHQDIQDKVCKEIDKVLEKHGELTYDAVSEMTYLHKVINETMRKYPPIPLVNRICTKEINLPTTNIHVPKGTLITIPIIGLHRDPSIYPNPDKFDPERFNADEIEARHSYAYLPFGEGPRNCIGSRFGYMQIKAGLVSLLSRYTFKLHPQTPVPLIFSEKGFTLIAKTGVYLIIEPRK
ncbi:putative cytochrome P450 6a20, partial [Trachymyrmex cornetzi]